MIIAFAGKKQSGKTTSSQFLVKHYDGIISSFPGIKIYNFADALKKDICINILGLTYDQCYGDDDAKNSLTNISWSDAPGYDISWTKMSDYDPSGYMTARQVMQFIGTDVFRKMKNDVWAMATINKIQIEQPKLAIIADCRFPNEVKSIKDAGGIVIKLTRNLYNSTHSSETALDPEHYEQSNFDLIVDNHDLSIQDRNRSILYYLEQKGILTL